MDPMKAILVDATESAVPPSGASAPAPAVPMVRRNGKPVSCEPCRIAKVRCDHTLPICSRCASRNMTAKCYYHPAPLTHKERAHPSPATKDSSSALRPRGSTKRKRADTSPRIPHLPQEASRSSSIQAELAPGKAGRREWNASSAADVGYLGSTSFMSVFTDSPEIINTAPVTSPTPEGHRLQHEGQHQHQAPEMRLARILCSEFDAHELLITEFYERSHFTAVPAPLVLRALSQTKQLIKDTESSGHKMDESIPSRLAAKITRNTQVPMHVSVTTTVEQLLDMFSGDSCRWEFVGLMFAISGFSAVNFPSRIPSKSHYEGRRLKGGAFAAEMLAASNACIRICEEDSNLNDVLTWLRYSHAVLASHILGDMNIHLYRRFAELVSDLFAMGFHRQQKFQFEIPFFLSETRRRIFSSAARRDKNLATYLGRPPLIHRFHCDVTLPLDLNDDDVILTGEALNNALQTVDQEGWNRVPDGELRPATIIRLRYHTCILRERVLDLTLGQKMEQSSEDAWKLLHDSRRIWTSIPAHFRYDATCWDRLTHAACLVSLTIFLEYLYSVFQIYRILQLENPSITEDLLLVCMQILSAVFDLMKQNGHKEELQERFSHLFLFYVLPSAGVLAYELRDCTLAGRAMPKSIPRSKIIRNLSLLVSWFENTTMQKSQERGACVEVTMVISRLLDDTLNHEARPQNRTHNIGGGRNQHDIEGLDSHAAAGHAQARNEPNAQMTSMPAFSSNSGVDEQTPSYGTSEEFLSWLDGFDWRVTFPYLSF